MVFLPLPPPAGDRHGPALPAVWAGQVCLRAGGWGDRPCHRPVLCGGAGAGPLQTLWLRPG